MKLAGRPDQIGTTSLSQMKSADYQNLEPMSVSIIQVSENKPAPAHRLAEGTDE
jgi:hypothetical protein